MKIKAARIEGGSLLLEVEDRQRAREFVYGFKPGEYDIVPARSLRSLDANGYCWALCTMIAEAIGSTKENVYRDAIKDVGIYKDFHGIAPGDAKTLITAWGNQGTGWVAEQVDYEQDGELVVIRAYYGSSVYNSKRMARLIDWLVDEAKGLGLETRPQEEIDSLLGGWREKRVRHTAWPERLRSVHRSG